ncbi:hypothetical protein [Streptomyces chrestomyceticus]|nr:hypothetical protein [Streptomyces chrestomyceticus]
MRHIVSPVRFLDAVRELERDEAVRSWSWAGQCAVGDGQEC